MKEKGGIPRIILESLLVVLRFVLKKLKAAEKITIITDIVMVIFILFMRNMYPIEDWITSVLGGSVL